jgi:cellulose synthase/poly-beta-1,6-N-acetylglucosamine synthase-like glycosyltransferase
MDTLFYLSVAFILYTYLLYPAGIWLLASRRKTPPPPAPRDQDCPPLTVVIAVHNEAHRLQAKISNIRSLDYPQDKVQILVVSDGSTDDTCAVLSKLPGVQTLSYPERQGKAHALNVAMAAVTTEVVVFNDVRQKADPMALRHLVASLQQPGVGAVSAELTHVDPATQTAANIGLYWRYEKWIRKSESDWFAVVGATGACYAIHRADYVPLEPGTLLDDFEIPMQIVRRGKRVLLDGRALFYDELQTDIAGEKKRKLRTLGGNFQSFARHPWLFSPTSNPIWLQFLSHKVCRLIVPYALLSTLLSSLGSSTPLIQASVVPQLAFYGLAALAARHEGVNRNRVASFARVFVELNWTAMLAGIQYWRGRQDGRWEKT